MKNSPFFITNLCDIYNFLKKDGYYYIKNVEGHYYYLNSENKNLPITKNEVVSKIVERLKDRNTILKTLDILDRLHLGKVIDKTLLPISQYMRTSTYYCATLYKGEYLVYSCWELEELIQSKKWFLYNYILNNIDTYEKELYKLK